MTVYRAGVTVSENGKDHFKIFGQGNTEKDAKESVDKKLIHFDHIHSTYEICQMKHP